MVHALYHCGLTAFDQRIKTKTGVCRKKSKGGERWKIFPISVCRSKLLCVI